MSTQAPSIMITAVGALIGQGIARSLAACGNPLVGLDRAPNAYGASLCDRFYTKPCVETDPAYQLWLRELIDQEKIGLILPGIEDDMFFFHDRRAEMADWPLRVALNSPAAIDAGRDKWLLHETLLRHGLPVIPTTAPADWEDLCAALGEPPFIAKAKRASGSRGQRVLRSEAEWQRLRPECGEGFIIQKLVGTDEEEYTVGLFGYGDGTSSDLFPLRRRLWSGGTWQAVTVASDTILTGFCNALTDLFQPLGPTNYQFRRVDGRYLLLEINPRFSAATAIRAGFGFNESMLCVEYYLDGRKRPQPGSLRGGTCQRYIADYFEFA